MNIQEQVDLRDYTTFGVQAYARYLTHITNQNEIIELMHHPLWQSEKHLILGRGSNILFTKDFDGMVVVNDIKGKKVVYENDEEIHVELGSGELWHDLVMWSVKQGLWGIENLALIPGTVGAAPVQNIGAYGVEVSSSILNVSGIDLKTGEAFSFSSEECTFGYRESIFKQAPNDYYISSVRFRLKKKGMPKREYGNLASFFQGVSDDTITPKMMAEAVIQVRRLKLPDVGEIGMAGSFFKNPLVSEEHFDQLKESYPGIPFFPGEKGYVKIPAGWFIETLFGKGIQKGNVGNYKKHALVLVNYGGAKGEEVWEFAQEVMDSVFARFSVRLEPEVLIF